MNKLWGGRFTKKTNPLVEKFTKSIHFDYKLAEYDCIGSLTHIDILKKANLLRPSEHKILQKGLENILQSVRDGTFKVDPACEDIHTQIQQMLDKSVGKVASKLHTCRSRNDQVVFDMKLFCLEELTKTQQLIEMTRKNLFSLALKNSRIYIPGYTHLQHAIPVSLLDYLMAYEHMLAVDQQRLEHVYKTIHLNMGSGALAGTFIDAQKYNNAVQSILSDELRVTSTTNSLYTVSDRDFILDFLSALSLIGLHLSRFAEDFILWSSKEFDFIDIDDSFCTGSSLMPQKKNPDVLELIRGYSGRLYGNLINVLVMMKGLPLTYNRDMQHDKEPLFDSITIVQNELSVLAALLENVAFKEDNINKQLDDECLYATDLSDFLVKNGVAFKDAHTIIGQLITCKLTQHKNILAMQPEELKRFHPLLTPAVVKTIINPQHSVNSKKSVRKIRKKI